MHDISENSSVDNEIDKPSVNVLGIQDSIIGKVLKHIWPLTLQLTFILIQDEDTDAIPLYVYICMSIGGTLAVVIILFVIGVCVRNKSRKIKELKSVKRNCENTRLNNQETLLIDLLSTKNKGVQNLKDLSVHANNFCPIQPEVQISARSSLTSFFIDNIGNKELDQQSEVTSSIQDSGIQSQGQIQEERLENMSQNDAYLKADFARKSVVAVIETSV